MALQPRVDVPVRSQVAPHATRCRTAPEWTEDLLVRLEWFQKSDPFGLTTARDMCFFWLVGTRCRWQWHIRRTTSRTPWIGVCCQVSLLLLHALWSLLLARSLSLSLDPFCAAIWSQDLDCMARFCPLAVGFFASSPHTIGLFCETCRTILFVFLNVRVASSLLQRQETEQMEPSQGYIDQLVRAMVACNVKYAFANTHAHYCLADGRMVKELLWQVPQLRSNTWKDPVCTTRLRKKQLSKRHDPSLPPDDDDDAPLQRHLHTHTLQE